MERFFGQIPGMGMGFVQGPFERQGMRHGRGRMGHFGHGWMQPAGDKVTVSGALALVSGRIALTQEGKTYYPVNLFHLAGFVDGFKEGAEVKAEGTAWPVGGGKDSFALTAATLTLNGKKYGFAQA